MSRGLLGTVGAVLCLTLALSVLAARAQKDAPARPLVGGETGAATPESLVGQDVQINFRGADDIMSPMPWDGVPRVPGKLRNMRGRVLRVQAGWIELSNEEGEPKTACWIPTSSVAMIMSVDALRGPTTQSSDGK